MHLCLETIHLRQPFGRAGRTQAQDPMQLLEHAYALGVRAFDAAGAYDEAEKILGAFLREMGAEDEVHVTTKIRPNALVGIADDAYYAAIYRSVIGSLRNLGVSELDVCLFHNAAYLDNPQALYALSLLKADGLATKVGVCTTEPEQFEKASASPYIDVIQIPYNIFDTRLDHLLSRTTKEIQARGIFLRGLILMDETEVPQNLWDIKPYLHTLRAYCERHGISRTELAITFAKTQHKISELIFAAKTVEQLTEDVALFARNGDETAMHELLEQLGGIDERILTPSLWRSEYR